VGFVVEPRVVLRWMSIRRVSIGTGGNLVTIPLGFY